MTTIKSYTDLSQSRKLAEILLLESADMEYLAIKETSKLVGGIPFVKDDSEVEDSAYSHIYDRIACWSLAALLDVIPEPDLVQNSEGTWLIHSWGYAYPWSVGGYSNPVDACYELILKLHEHKLL